MKNSEQRIVEIILKAQQPNASLKDLEKSAAAMRAQLRGMSTDAKDFAEKSKALQDVQKRIKGLKDEISGTGGVFNNLLADAKRFGPLMLSYLGFEAISGQISKVIQGNYELSDSYADLRKTTGMTAIEVERVDRTLGNINTRTPRKELRDIAIEAGKLGIAKNDILAFTVATDKLNVALGDEFGSAAEITKQMGNLRKIFKDVASDKIDEDMLHIGNAINYLASEGSSTGPGITDFSNRIGGLGIQLGLTSGQTLGLSATLEELNVNAERGGTAIVKILQKMTTHTAEFAKIANMDVKSFTDLVNKDLFGAFMKVIEGSKKSGTSATALGKIIQDLGVEGAGASEVFAKLGSNTDLLEKRVKSATTQLQGTSSIMQEFNLKNENFAAKVDKIGKALNSAFTNSAVMHGIEAIVSLFADLVTNTESAATALQNETVNVNSLVMELTSSNTEGARRNEIYDTLLKNYPEILDGIDKENINTAKLTGNLNKFNEAQINRIILSKKDVDIEKENTKAAEIKLEMLNKQGQAYEYFSKYLISSGKYYGTEIQTIINSNDTFINKMEKIRALKKDFDFKSAPGTIQERQAYANALTSANIAVIEQSHYELELVKATAAGNALQREKAELMQQFGMIDNKITKQEVDNKKAVNTAIVEQTEEEKKAADKVAKLRDDLHKKLLELAQQENQYYMTEREKELDVVKIRYAKLLEEANGNKADILKIKELQRVAELRINAKYDEAEVIQRELHYAEFMKLMRKVNGEEVSAMDLQIQAIEDKYKKVIEFARKYGTSADVENLILKRDIEISDSIDQSNGVDTRGVSNDGLVPDAKSESKKAKADLHNKQQYANEVVNIANNLDSALSNIEQRRLNKELQANEKKKADFKKLLDSKKISQADYDKKVIALDENLAAKQLEVRKKQAKREKVIAMFQAGINTAMAASQINANPAVNADITQTLRGILTALVIGAGVTQQIAIATAPEPFAKGGFTGDGIGVTDNTGYKIAGVVHQDEWVGPKWMLKNPRTAPVINWLEDFRTGKTPRYADGGMTPKSSVDAIASNGVAVNNNGELVTAINNNTAVMQQLLSEGVEARLYYDEFKRSLAEIERAKGK